MRKTVGGSGRVRARNGASEGPPTLGDAVAEVDNVLAGHAELCAFFRRGGRSVTGRYEVLQVGANAGWGRIWTFPSRDTHAAERAMHRLVAPSIVPVRHACRVRLRLRLRTDKTSGAGSQVAEVVVVTILPERAQFVLVEPA